MAVICPTVTAENPHQYREQIERVAPFVSHVHIDFMDGDFTPNQSPGLGQGWWPHTMQADLHIMFKKPQDFTEQIIKLNPRLVIVHAEAEGNFVEFAEVLHGAGILAGVALLPKTDVKTIIPALEHIDHVLIFSGSLGHFGGEADTSLLDKVEQLKKLKHSIEIGWDGGINDQNVKKLSDYGVDILNVGGYIQQAKEPKANYEMLQNLLK
jgi:ribulose-phosphate 3-epimerase